MTVKSIEGIKKFQIELIRMLFWRGSKKTSTGFIGTGRVVMSLQFFTSL